LAFLRRDGFGNTKVNSKNIGRIEKDRIDEGNGETIPFPALDFLYFYKHN